MCCDNKLAHLNWCCHLLNSYPASMVNFIWFADDKLLNFIAATKITQNNRFHTLVG